MKYLTTLRDKIPRDTDVTNDEIITVRHEVGGSEGVVRQPDVAVYYTIAEGVQLAVNLHLVVLGLRPDLAGEFLAQFVTPEYD